MKDYYNILEISNDADNDTIRKAYKKMALKWHPDKNNDMDTTEKFKEISEAYQILIDENKRLLYDNSNKYSNNNFENYEFEDPHQVFSEIVSKFKKTMDIVNNVLDIFDDISYINNIKPEFVDFRQNSFPSIVTSVEQFISNDFTHNNNTYSYNYTYNANHEFHNDFKNNDMNNNNKMTNQYIRYPDSMHDNIETKIIDKQSQNTQVNIIPMHDLESIICDRFKY